MKKLLLAMLATSTILVACGEEDASQESNDSTEEVATNESTEDSTSEAEENNQEEAEATQEEVEEEIDEELEDEPLPDDQTDELTLNQPIEFEGFTITFTNFELVKDFDGNDVLKYTYDWENTSDETIAPFMTYSLRGFQNGVETDYAGFTEEVDLSIGQRDVRPGGSIQAAEGEVGVEDVNSPLELELQEAFSWSDEAYSTVIDLNELQ